MESFITRQKSVNHSLNEKKKQGAKTALITGAGRRIGAAIALHLHQAGFRVAIHCHHSITEANLLAEKLNDLRPDSASVFQADLSSYGSSTHLVNAVNLWASSLDVLVNNASLFIKNEYDYFNATDWQALFQVNVQAPYELSIFARTMLSRSQGVIINITDIHADRPLKDYGIYCQTKAALTMQTKVLAKAFAPSVRVNAVAPGAIAWPEKENTLSEIIQKKIIADTPLQCHGEPKYVAMAVKALIDNPFITGQVLTVDGGRSTAVAL